MHRGAAAGDAGDRSAATGAAAAEQHAVVLRGDAPGAHLIGRLGPWPLEIAVEDVAAGQAQVRFEVLRALRLDARRAVLIEGDVDQVPDETLFHLINMAANTGGGLLITDRTLPSNWPTNLPDLRSRLNALPVAEIDEPDDAVLAEVIRKFFRERNIRPTDDLLPYLLRRIERSVPKAREIVARLDEASDAAQRPISRALARQFLENSSDTLDLFA